MLLVSIALLLQQPLDVCSEKLKPAFIALQQKNPSQASSILDANREGCSETSLYSELLGTTSELLGRPAAASAAFEKAVSLEPNNARFHFELGASYVENGNPQEAVKQLKAGLALDPSNASGERYLLGVYVASKDWQNASQMFQSLGAFDRPSSLKDGIMILWLARVLVETKKTERINAVISPDNPAMTPPLLFSLAGLFAEYRMYGEVVRYLSRISDHDADDAVYFNLGDAYSHLQEFDKARVFYFRAIDKHADHVEAYLHVGFDYVSGGEPRKGVPWLAKAHSLAPDRPDIAYALAEQLIDLQYLTSAADLLKTALASHPDDPLLLVSLGDLKAAEGQKEDAIHSYQDALAKKPGLVQALVSLAQLEIAQASYDEAKKSLDLALSTDADNAAAERAMGLLEEKEGRWAAAVLDLEKAHLQNRANAEIGLELGRAYHRTGRLSEALRLLSSLDFVFHDSPAYHLELSQLYGQMHRTEQSKAELSAFDALQKAAETSLPFERARTYVF